MVSWCRAADIADECECGAEGLRDVRPARSGAPWSMKMGNIVSPWRYEDTSGLANTHAQSAAACRKHTLKLPTQAAARLVGREADAVFGGGSSRSAGTRKWARNLCTI